MMKHENTAKHDLALVMPVYNEEECIADVVRSWCSRLSGLEIDFLMIVLNDGSEDGTKDKLAQLENNNRIVVVNKKNSGHGPTILQGYHMAIDKAQYVFQIDSDNEMKPDGFNDLWSKRSYYDALFGYRVNRNQNLARKLISKVSRITTKILFGSGVKDVNTPYRLIRSPILKKIVEHIPDNTFAPNVIISGALARSHARILNIPVAHENRQTGSVSIMKWKLWKAAAKAFWQTVSAAQKFRGYTIKKHQN